MKRLAALLILLFLLPLTATAEGMPKPFEDFINVYNSRADYYAVPPLSFNGWRLRDDNYSITSDDMSISVSIFDDSHSLATIVIPPQDITGDFLAVCACLSAAVRGESQDNYADILYAYFLLRTAAPGERITYKSPNGLIFFQRDEDLFLFGVSN